MGNCGPCYGEFLATNVLGLENRRCQRHKIQSGHLYTGPSAIDVIVDIDFRWSGLNLDCMLRKCGKGVEGYAELGGGTDISAVQLVIVFSRAGNGRPGNGKAVGVNITGCEYRIRKIGAVLRLSGDLGPFAFYCKCGLSFRRNGLHLDYIPGGMLETIGSKTGLGGLHFLAVINLIDVFSGILYGSPGNGETTSQHIGDGGHRRVQLFLCAGSESKGLAPVGIQPGVAPRRGNGFHLHGIRG